MAMKHLIKTEPKHFDACAQFSIAMAIGAEPADVARDLGSWDGVSTYAILDYLKRAGYSNGEYSKRPVTANNTSGVVTIYGNKEGHAMAYENGTVLDPNGEVFGNITEACRYYEKHTGDEWGVTAVIPCAPVKTREFAVKPKEGVGAQ